MNNEISYIKKKTKEQMFNLEMFTMSMKVIKKDLSQTDRRMKKLQSILDIMEIHLQKLDKS
jgi:hypothetical protein